MKAKIIGVKSIDFTPEGKDRINGTKLFLAIYPTSDKSLFGGKTKDAWLTPDRLKDVVQSVGVLTALELVDKSINVAFDENGKLDTIQPIAEYGAPRDIAIGCRRR